MNSTWTGMNLLSLSLLTSAGLILGPLTAHAEAGYGDAISARTQKNTGTTGQWYELSTADWVFYEGEASAQYNLGAIAAGTKVEVLKMNKQMARVRLPDGRVVFIRNRILTSTAAPKAAEKQAQALRTATIGQTKIHGGSPHARPKDTDFQQTPEAIAAAAVPERRPVTHAEEREYDKKPNLGSVTRGFATPGADAVIPLPGADGTVVVPSGTLATVPSGTLATVPSGTIAASPAPADSAQLPDKVPVPIPRPTDVVQEDAAQTNGACDPKKQWQSPVRQKYRITDCLGSSRDGGGRRHAGIDIAGERPGMQGLPIFPTATGRVIRSGHNGGYGCFVEIKHDTCPDSIVKWRRQSGCITRYAHLAMKTVKNRKGKNVRVCDVIADGSQVTPCTRIGKMSGTGRRGNSNDYASHLHFELRDDSTSVAYNPNTLIASLRRSPAFMSTGSASCKASNGIDAADVGRLNNGRIAPIANVRETEGRN